MTEIQFEEHGFYDGDTQSLWVYPSTKKTLTANLQHWNWAWSNSQKNGTMGRVKRDFCCGQG